MPVIHRGSYGPCPVGFVRLRNIFRQLSGSVFCVCLPVYLNVRSTSISAVFRYAHVLARAAGFGALDARARAARDRPMSCECSIRHSAAMGCRRAFGPGLLVRMRLCMIALGAARGRLGAILEAILEAVPRVPCKLQGFLDICNGKGFSFEKLF